MHFRILMKLQRAQTAQNDKFEADLLLATLRCVWMSLHLAGSGGQAGEASLFCRFAAIACLYAVGGMRLCEACS